MKYEVKVFDKVINRTFSGVVEAPNRYLAIAELIKNNTTQLTMSYDQLDYIFTHEGKELNMYLKALGIKVEYARRVK